MKERSLFIFVPSTLTYNKCGYLKICYKEITGNDSYFIISDQIYNTRPDGHTFGKILSSKNNRKDKLDLLQFYHIDSVTKKPLNTNYSTRNGSVVLINYDYNSFRKSDVLHMNCDFSFGEHFKALGEYLKESRLDRSTLNMERFVQIPINSIEFLLKILIMLNSNTFLTHSATFRHFESSLTQLKWFLSCLLHKEKGPKLGNAFLAKLVDIIVGVILVDMLIKNQKFIFNGISDLTEGIILKLIELLFYLMGSPIGLKLNYAFTTYLGTFFFYHISLWRVFLKGVQPEFINSYQYLILPGLFGFTFQIAMISDIIAIATFHVYCIYVYAARLFNLQIKGIIALWRLFIGRKYNPLRQRVDSCDYAQNQLFIGTLGFTVLLFLLPTTLLYYTVFATLRLSIYIINVCLTKLRYNLNRLPLYTIYLWLIKSRSVAGNLYVEWQQQDGKYVSLNAHLHTLSLMKSIGKFVPFESDPKEENSSLTDIVHSILTGVVL